MEIRPYLDRIGWKGGLKPSAANLQVLQLAHLQTVPFENLSIHTGERIRLDLPWLFDKIVMRRRGGFCYELNGLFAWLLKELGYPVTMLAARVRSEETGLFGREFAHMVLKVDLEQSWLVDVGFGRAYNLPLALRLNEIQEQDAGRFKITQEGEELMYWREAGEWLPDYRFSLAPRSLEEFEPMCRYQQTSPQSYFTRKWFITMLTPEGRQTLHQDGRDYRLVTTTDASRHDRAILGMENAQILLEEIFRLEDFTFARARRRKAAGKAKLE